MDGGPLDLSAGFCDFFFVRKKSTHTLLSEVRTIKIYLYSK